MKRLIGIRREDKNQWERRVPLTPRQVRLLREEHQVETHIQPSSIRVFSDNQYRAAGALVTEELTSCPLVFAIKEIPEAFFQEGKTYVFFAHVIKGQKFNMPMLRRMLELGCNLVDYEKMEDADGQRLLFFGPQAGRAGMMDTLWAFGQRLNWEGLPTAFQELTPAHEYGSLDEAKQALAAVGARIRQEGLPSSLTPLVCGFSGYGKVAQGAQEIFDLLPVKELPPEDLVRFVESGSSSTKQLYKVVFHEKHMVRPKAPAPPFELQDYYDHPERYEPQFEQYVPCLTLLMNCIYWDERYPRLVTRPLLRRLFGEDGTPPPRLRVIGDVSCDLEGAVECTLRATDPGHPVYVYEPAFDHIRDGVAGNGPVVMAVDNLPCELPLESSTGFGEALAPFVPALANADFSVAFERCVLPEAIKKAVIAYHGELTGPFRYLSRHLTS